MKQSIREMDSVYKQYTKESDFSPGLSKTKFNILPCFEII